MKYIILALTILMAACQPSDITATIEDVEESQTPSNEPTPEAPVVDDGAEPDLREFCTFRQYEHDGIRHIVSEHRVDGGFFIFEPKIQPIALRAVIEHMESQGYIQGEDFEADIEYHRNYQGYGVMLRTIMTHADVCQDIFYPAP